VRSRAGRALYARRKVIVEPVFGQIKEARGFRRFLLRGLDNIRGEWRLGCVAPNLLKIWRYACGPLTALPRRAGAPFTPHAPFYGLTPPANPRFLTAIHLYRTNVFL